MNSLAKTVVDKQGRQKRKLRLSLTDRCNFRCGYCMPKTPTWLPRENILRREELVYLSRLFIRDLGINQIRLTGGEPLLRRDVIECVAELNRLRADGLERISMTSNSALLADKAVALKTAGLDDINISLDILDPIKFKDETGGELAPVLAGIEAAIAAGLGVKLNAVAIKGYNHEQLVPLTRWAMAKQIELRFIEFMPLDGNQRWSPDKVLSEAEILQQLRCHWPVSALPRSHAPATAYELVSGAQRYRLGIISTISKPFCSSCDRLRLTATGQLYNCLFSATGKDLLTALRNAEADSALLAMIRNHVWHKESGYQGGYVERPLTMHALGG